MELNKSLKSKKTKVLIGTLSLLTVLGLCQAAFAQVWAPVEFRIMVSETANKTQPAELDGAAVSEKIAIFTSDVRTTESVMFFLDDPERMKAPTSTDDTAPFDFANGEMFDTSTLSVGEHSITAVQHMKSGRVHVDKAFFEVRASAGGTTPTTTTPSSTVAPTTTSTTSTTTAPTSTTSTSVTPSTSTTSTSTTTAPTSTTSTTSTTTTPVVGCPVYEAGKAPKASNAQVVTAMDKNGIDILKLISLQDALKARGCTEDQITKGKVHPDVTSSVLKSLGINEAAFAKATAEAEAAAGA